ncbi:MAG: hypothetical protein V3T77_08075 [Planctomycetota bacterium]
MLSQRTIFRLWSPLAATWLMMAAEGPLLAAIVARLSEPRFNLAAYGVSLSIALLVEAPVIMMMSAATALVCDRDSYLRLRNFTFALSLGVTLVMGVLALPPIFYPVALELIGLPQQVADLTYWAIVLLLPWPGAIGYRRFYQGLLIRSHRTRLIAMGTLIRLFTMVFVSFFLFLEAEVSGACVAAVALSSGVLVEAVAIRWMAHSTIAELGQEEPSLEPLSYPTIATFYYPLALTSFLVLGVQPLITFFVGHSREAVDSLAVLPVVHSLVFVFRSQGLALQEVAVALAGRRLEGYEPLRLFTGRLALLASAGLALIAFTPLAVVWYEWLSGLSSDLAGLAVTTSRLLFALPGLAVLLSFQRGLLVSLRRTSSITWSSLIEVISIVVVLSICVFQLELLGAVAAAVAMVVGRASASLYLWRPVQKNVAFFSKVA